MRKFTNYEVTALARQLTVSLYSMVENFPKKEQYALCQQIRRAAVSVGANIAEGAGRKTAKDFAHFMTQSIGSTCELEYLLLISQDLGYLTADEREGFDKQIQLLKSKLFRFREVLLKNAV